MNILNFWQEGVGNLFIHRNISEWIQHLQLLDSQTEKSYFLLRSLFKFSFDRLFAYLCFDIVY